MNQQCQPAFLPEMWPCLTCASADCRPVAHTSESYTRSEMSNWTLVTSLGSSSPFTGLTSLINLWGFCVCQIFSLTSVLCFFYSEHNSTKLIWLTHNCRKMNNWTRVGALDTSFLQPLTSLRTLWASCMLLLGCRPVAHTIESCACSEISNWTGVTSLWSSSPLTGQTSLVSLWEFCAC